MDQTSQSCLTTSLPSQVRQAKYKYLKHACCPLQSQPEAHHTQLGLAVHAKMASTDKCSMEKWPCSRSVSTTAEELTVCRRFRLCLLI